MSKKYIASGVLVVLVAICGVIYTAIPSSEGVVETYAETIKEELPPREELGEQMQRDARMLANLLGEIDKLESNMLDMNEKFQVSQNQNEGLYTVEQERYIAQSYGRYLVLRKALFSIAFRYKDYAKLDTLQQQDEAFLLAYTSGMVLYRNAVVFVALFKDQPNARKKLNEADPILQIPAGMMDEMFVNITTPDNVELMVNGVTELGQRRERLADSSLLGTPGLEHLFTRLDRYEGELATAYERLSEGKRDIIWAHLKKKVEDPKYKAQSFISVVVGHMRTPLHARGLDPKSVKRDLRPLLKPGDILLTRRDGYLSNTFLPGFWGHAALYLGSRDEIVEELGADPELKKSLDDYRGEDQDGEPFMAIEAIGEGVRLSSLEFALHANLVAVLRPKLTPEQKRTAIVRALAMRGTPYDFAFDMASQDKIICTELVYRAYSPHLEGPFEDVMGRKTLKPDGMLRLLDPTAPEPVSEFVAYGESNDGTLRLASVDELMQTVSSKP
jgi:hypothetical protein